MSTLPPSPNRQQILKQILKDAGIISPSQKVGLTKQFDKRYSEVAGLMSEHRRRQERFTASQNRVLAKHYATIEKAKESIEKKQRQAESKKGQEIKEKLKRNGLELDRWRYIIESNRKKKKQELVESQKVIQDWSKRLDACSSKKSIKLKSKTEEMRLRREEAEKSFEQSKSKREHETLDVSRRRNSRRKRAKSPYIRTEQEEILQSQLITEVPFSNRYSVTDKSRYLRGEKIARQAIRNKKRQIDHRTSEHSLANSVDKSKRIADARRIKTSLFEQRLKSAKQRDSYITQVQEQNLATINSKIQQRNKRLDRKFYADVNRPVAQLPTVKGSQVTRFMTEINSNRSSQEKIVNRNYNRMILDKLRDVSMGSRMRYRGD